MISDQIILTLNLIKIYPLETPDVLHGISTKFINFFSGIFVILLIVATVTTNISLIWGGIIYLLDYKEENGKKIIIRSFIVLMLIIILFNPHPIESSPALGSLDDFNYLTSYITSYLLFIFASISKITFIGNLGLYLLASNRKRIYTIKKSCLCLFCVLLPLGFQLPIMPIW
ncbi:MAG: hypothetical protein ACFFDN_26375 [Candidatus Hodarchaeota archaeon]